MINNFISAKYINIAHRCVVKNSKYNTLKNRINIKINFNIYDFLLCIGYAERRCSTKGEWIGRNVTSDAQTQAGWTNYTPCYTPEMQHIMNMLYLNRDTAKVSSCHNLN